MTASGKYTPGWAPPKLYSQEGTLFGAQLLVLMVLIVMPPAVAVRTPV
jgi:hypothetical protein